MIFQKNHSFCGTSTKFGKFGMLSSVRQSVTFLETQPRKGKIAYESACAIQLFKRQINKKHFIFFLLFSSECKLTFLLSKGQAHKVYSNDINDFSFSLGRKPACFWAGIFRQANVLSIKLFIFHDITRHPPSEKFPWLTLYKCWWLRVSSTRYFTSIITLSCKKNYVRCWFCWFMGDFSWRNSFLFFW